MPSCDEEECTVQVQTSAKLLQLQKREILQKHLKTILKNNKKSLSSFVPLAPFLPIILPLGGAPTSTSTTESSLLAPPVAAAPSSSFSAFSLSSGVALHVFVQTKGLGEEGGRPVEGFGVWLLREEAVRPCCLVAVVVVELVQLMAAHIALGDDVEISGREAKQTTLLIA